jgi:hypothetical protein
MAGSNLEAGKATCHVPTFPHLMRLRSPLPLATLALVVYILGVPFASAASWTAARKLEMRFVESNAQKLGFLYEITQGGNPETLVSWV